MTTANLFHSVEMDERKTNIVLSNINVYVDDTAVIVSDSNWESVWQKCEADMSMRQLTYFYIIGKKKLNKNLIRITYFAMAQSIIQYGLIAWGGCNSSLKNKQYIGLRSLNTIPKELLVVNIHALKFNGVTKIEFVLLLNKKKICIHEHDHYTVGEIKQ
ncbi:Reverse transcriptase domain-containing protein [Aphis craccivora]|uniref:Reverse transcriptase domain-containing protein n=1 Tax=Aphis craccivora TaxID=307492 RepID=A0A6G0ZE20_APHCR|nr:Reverse transcriptase domain-containing protein [Aphis craccivora]